MVSRNLKILYSIKFLIAQRFFSAILVIYFVSITHSYTQAMSLFAVSTVTQAILEIPTGVFSDRIGRKYTTVLSVFSAFCSVLLYAIGHEYLILLGGAIIEGIARALGSGNNEALLHDSLKELGCESEYHKYYGKMAAAEKASFGIAALIGGFIIAFSIPLAMWVSVTTQFIALLCSLFITEPSIHTPDKENVYTHLTDATKEFLANPKIQLLSISKAIRSAFSEAAYQLSPAFIATIWPLWALGILKIAVNFVSAGSSYVYSRVMDKVSAAKLFVVTFLMARAVTVLAYAFPSIVSPALIGSAALGYGVEVAENSLLQREYTDKQRATMGSLDSIKSSIIFSIISLMVGNLADLIGLRNILLIIQIFMCSVLVFYWKLFSKCEILKKRAILL